MTHKKLIMDTLLGYLFFISITSQNFQNLKKLELIVDLISEIAETLFYFGNTVESEIEIISFLGPRPLSLICAFEIPA